MNEAALQKEIASLTLQIKKHNEQAKKSAEKRLLGQIARLAGQINKVKQQQTGSQPEITAKPVKPKRVVRHKNKTFVNKNPTTVSETKQKKSTAEENEIYRQIASIAGVINTHKKRVNDFKAAKGTSCFG